MIGTVSWDQQVYVVFGRWTYKQSLTLLVVHVCRTQAKDKAGQARAVVFPVDGIVEEEEAVRAMYLRSHAAYAPGEQRRRDYQWDKAGVDPVTNRFGAMSSTEGREGVKKALQPDLDQGVPVSIAMKLGTMSNTGRLQVLALQQCCVCLICTQHQNHNAIQQMIANGLRITC